MNKLLEPSLTQTIKKLQKPLLPIKGAIFDLDGVLTDSSELHYLAWKKLAEEENIHFSREDNEALRGIPRRESLLLILKDRKVSDLQIQELMERKNQYYVESISMITEQDLLPGARDFLIDLRSAGIKTAVGSASKNAKTLIEKLGISDLLDAIADGFSVIKQKPAPDLFLHAAKLIGIQPSQCLVFEDAAAGIEAAIAGGMWAIGIGPQQRLKTAHVIFNNLEGLSVKKMNELLTRVTKF